VSIDAVQGTNDLPALEIGPEMTAAAPAPRDANAIRRDQLTVRE
jgi:hypothetical protein